jgi:hypothetical protein
VGVFVVGMHRSGTSAATRLVNLLGVETCLARDLFAPSPDNPRGNWESSSLTAFNDRLLGALACDWTCPVRLDVGWEDDPRLSSLSQEAADLFPRVIPSEQWVWKDPRNCVVLPFWRRVLDVEPAVVLVHRHPLEIATSLQARGDLDEGYALALWERYLRLALAAVASLPTIVTAYTALVEDPLGWCAHTSEFLQSVGVRTSTPASAEVLAFVDRDLRHSHLMAESVSQQLSRPQRALLDGLEDLFGLHSALARPRLPAESPSTETLLAERRHAVRMHPTWKGARDTGSLGA